jgi:hypothetical protein
MDRKARRNLESAVSELRQIAEKAQAIAPEANAQAQSDLLHVQQQSEAAIAYYNSILPRPRRTNVPRLAQTVAQAAFGASGIGLVPPQFVPPAAKLRS